MFSVVLLLSILTFSLQLCSGQILQFGKCADVTTMRYFDVERFLGKWYEIERFPTWYENYGTCAYKTVLWCNRRIEIEHGFVRQDIQYILHVNSSYSPGDKAVFNIEENNIDPIGIPFTVLSTDYSEYAVVYGCKNSEVMDIKYLAAWILSRQPTMSPQTLKMAQDVLNSVPYANVAYLEPVVQDEEQCKYKWTAHVQAEAVNEVTEATY